MCTALPLATKCSCVGDLRRAMLSSATQVVLVSYVVEQDESTAELEASVSRRIDFSDDPRAPAANSLVPSVNVVVVNTDDSVLMIRRSDNGNWAVPGGAVDLGESVAQAAVRETLEESGITGCGPPSSSTPWPAAWTQRSAACARLSCSPPESAPGVAHGRATPQGERQAALRGTD